MLIRGIMIRAIHKTEVLGLIEHDESLGKVVLVIRLLEKSTSILKRALENQVLRIWLSLGLIIMLGMIDKIYWNLSFLPIDGTDRVGFGDSMRIG